MNRATVEAAVGVLLEDGRVWVQTRRATGHLDGSLEFPGGKLEPGESPLDALLREVLEETGIALDPSIPEPLLVRRHAYPDRDVTLHFFLCRLRQQQPAGAGAWIRVGDLREKDFPPANREVLEWLAGDGPMG